MKNLLKILPEFVSNALSRAKRDVSSSAPDERIVSIGDSLVTQLGRMPDKKIISIRDFLVEECRATSDEKDRATSDLDIKLPRPPLDD